MPPLIQHISFYFPSVLLQLYCAFLFTQPLQFDRFSIQDGLSESMVRCIEQDGQGFLWFGTADGLNRFDGYEFVVFKHDPDDPASLCDNNVWKVLFDKQGKLWVGTSAGLGLFDKKRQGFIHFTPDGGEQKINYSVQALCESRNGKLWVGTSNGLFIFDRVKKVFIPISISGGKEKVWVSCILEGHRGDIWVGTKDDGLFGIVQPGNRIIHYQWEKGDTNTISGSWVSTLYEDSHCQLWVGAKFGGICQIDPERNRVHRLPSGPKAPYNQNNITAILEDSGGNFWLGSQIGLFQIEPKTGRIHHFQHQSDNERSLSTNSISCMFEDRDGGMWIGTWENGINYWNKHRKTFFYHPLSNEKGKETHLVKALEETEDGNLWIGADGSGLYFWDRKEGITRHWEQPDNPQSNQIWAIRKDQKGRIWLGTRNGIYRFHPDKSNLQYPDAPFSGIHFQPDEKGSFGLSHRDVSCLFEDSRGRMWAGTLNGVNRFDSRQNKFVPYFHEDGNPHSLSNNWIWVIFEGRDGKIWIGTNNGLNQFDEEKDNFIRFFHDPRNPNGLSNNNIWDLYEDRQGNLWAGTTGGLNRYQLESGQFSVWRSKDGLKNDNVTNILEDKQGNLWLTNFQGLSKFDPQIGAFENFEPFHLQPASYSRTFIETQSGGMIYGVRGGLVLFHPDSIDNNPIKPTIVITGFNLHVGHSVEGEPSDSINSRPAGYSIPLACIPCP